MHSTEMMTSKQYHSLAIFVDFKRRRRKPFVRIEPVRNEANVTFNWISTTLSPFRGFSLFNLFTFNLCLFVHQAKVNVEMMMTKVRRNINLINNCMCSKQTFLSSGPSKRSILLVFWLAQSCSRLIRFVPENRKLRKSNICNWLKQPIQMSFTIPSSTLIVVVVAVYSFIRFGWLRKCLQSAMCVGLMVNMRMMSMMLIILVSKNRIKSNGKAMLEKKRKRNSRRRRRKAQSFCSTEIKQNQWQRIHYTMPRSQN